METRFITPKIITPRIIRRPQRTTEANHTREQKPRRKVFAKMWAEIKELENPLSSLGDREATRAPGGLQGMEYKNWGLGLLNI